AVTVRWIQCRFSKSRGRPTYGLFSDRGRSARGTARATRVRLDVSAGRHGSLDPVQIFQVARTPDVRTFLRSWTVRPRHCARDAGETGRVRRPSRFVGSSADFPSREDARRTDFSQIVDGPP